MNANELKEFKTKVIAYFEKVKSKGTKLTTYQCLHCKATLETIQPTKVMVSSKGYWDSMKACYECGEASFVKTWPNGNTEVINLKTL